MRIPTLGLPLEPHLPGLLQTLADSTSLVVSAEPGAGKTTLIPLALLDAPWLKNNKILMLEPRRLAAQAAARRMADLLVEPVGQTVGYRISLDSCVGPQTRIEVLTEGILTRMIQNDPELTGVGVIIFDEFHERSLHADLALALTLEARSVLRPELRVLVMSATLDFKGVSELLGGAPSVDCQGRCFPVDVMYHALPDSQTRNWGPGPHFSASFTAEKIRSAIKEHPGDALVFLPGQSEIRRVQGELGSLGDDIEILPLFGNLSGLEQLRVLTPPKSGLRRIILSTSIAETSLTIPGVRIVIDAGLSRITRFDPRTGMDRLVTERVSRASALQRQGRAGRTAKGVCWKLWQPADVLEAFSSPEIERSDLTPLVLEASVWGARNPGDLRWMSPPPAALWNQARDLLTELEALADGCVTAHGRKIAELSMHPRLAHMVLKSQQNGLGELALGCAVLLGEKDILVNSQEIDFRSRLEVLAGRGTLSSSLNMVQLQRAQENFKRWSGQIRGLSPNLGGLSPKNGGLSPNVSLPNLGGLSPSIVDRAAEVLALAFPDRVGIKQELTGAGAQFQFTSGRAGVLAGALSQSEAIVAPDADAGTTLAKIYLAAPLQMEKLYEIFHDQIKIKTEISWNGLRPRVRRQRCLFRLVLESRDALPQSDDEEEIRSDFMNRLRKEGLSILPWDDELRQELERIRFAAHFLAKRRADLGPWPELGDENLITSASDWLSPFLKIGKTDILDHNQFANAIGSLLKWNQRSLLEKEAPTHLVVPSGSRRPLEYCGITSPILSVRIQEVFGLPSTPLLCGQPVLLHLLSPAQRPLQVTADLASFWKNTYQEVKKEMKGRYPRHYWPEDPLQAEPTARAKPRGT